MAMALCRHMAEERGIPVRAVSAGYFDWGPFAREAHPFARRAVEQLCGGDLLRGHRAARWNHEMVRSADLIVVAEEWMCADFPVSTAITMRGLAGQTGDVEDPYGEDFEVFLECATELRALLLAGWAIVTGKVG